MPNLPKHVGRETNSETNYALVCTAVTSGNPDVDPLCGRRATHHIRWQESTTENGFACPDHLEMATRFHPYDLHSVKNSACGMPGSWWISGEPSYCTMMALDERPTFTETRAVPVGI